MKFKGRYIVIIFVGSVALWSFWGSSDSPTVKLIETGHDHNEGEHQNENIVALSDNQIENLGIQTKIAGPGELSLTISTRGKIILHPDKIAHILPKISGVAKEARKNIGDPIKEGEVLAILESREMADIKANYLAAKEKGMLALSMLEREQRLRDKKISAEQDYFNAKSAFAEAKITIQLAEQKLHAFGITDDEIKKLSVAQDLDLGLYVIRSPLDGVVIARHITKGEFIENTTLIYEVADLRTVWIEIGIYPKDLSRVKEGQMVDISLPVDGKVGQAKIIYLSPIIQDETITAKAVAEMDNSQGNWRPGSFVRVNISTQNVSVPIVIPKEAIQEIQGKEFVFVRVKDGFERRQTRLGASDNDNVEVIAGLSAGEEYASSKAFLLKADLRKKEAEHEH